MNREELLALGLTEEQVNKIMADYGKAIQAEQLKTKAEKEKAKKAEELQKMLDEIEAGNLSEIEAANKRSTDAESRIAELTKQLNKSEVTSILNKAGIAEDDYNLFVDAFVTENIDTSKSMANAFIESISKRDKALEAKFKETALDNTPGIGGEANTKVTELTQAELIATKAAESVVGNVKTSSEIMGKYL